MACARQLKDSRPLIYIIASLMLLSAAAIAWHTTKAEES